jgi:hypothetical protein
MTRSDLPKPTLKIPRNALRLKNRMYECVDGRRREGIGRGVYQALVSENLMVDLTLSDVWCRDFYWGLTL